MKRVQGSFDCADEPCWLVCFAQDDNDENENGGGMTIALESMAVVMPEVEGHPNRAAFRGVLTVVDTPSQRAPSGSNGRRVVLTKAAAEAALASLLGMAVDYAPSFDRHDVRRKVGVITSADVVGRNLEVGGYLYAKDFPDIVQEIAKGRPREKAEIKIPSPSTPPRHAVDLCSGQALAQRMHKDGALGALAMQAAFEGERGRLRASLSSAVERIRNLAMTMRGSASGDPTSAALRGGASTVAAGELGMSFEVTDVLVADSRMKVWTLMKVTFTGAAILRKDKAAYQDTWIELRG
jgi:hypothetical protein